MANDALKFGRRLAVADVVLLGAELLVVFTPLMSFLQLDGRQRALLPRVSAVVWFVALALWLLVTRVWRAPLSRACRRRVANETLDTETRAAAYQALLHYPRRALMLRVALWSAGATVTALALHVRAAFSSSSVVTVIAVATAHAFGVAIFRALAYTRILDKTRAALLPDFDSLRLFADSYEERFTLAALATGALGIFGIATFTYFFVPINLEQYLRLETWFPLTMAVLTLGWWAYARALPRPIDRYLEAALSPRPADQPLRDDPRAVAAYRAAQTIPYKLALAKVGFWLIAELLLVLEGVAWFSMDLENAALMCGAAVVITIGAALYEAVWHRATVRPLLVHVASRHRPRPDSVATPLSLRSKMLAGFGALTFFACGMSLFLSYMQYKTMATGFIQRESELRLDSTIAELRERAARQGAPSQSEILSVLAGAARWKAPPGSVQDEAVIYYLPPAQDARPVAIGGGKQGPPPLPWTGEALMRRLDRGDMELSGHQLTGAYARVYIGNADFGSIAVLLSGYRGRGPDLAPQVKVLIYFFIVLLIVSMGLVILVATDLTRPIRELERRADAMAKGDLIRPVVSFSGEADEVGRLTFAFEEMRRALNEKLRSSTEINLSLEQEVTRRTAELERRNKELHDALEQLQRAQDELVRSEKMASMGRLVAGIAHEINNPVNAVVNTVGPLEDLLSQLKIAADSKSDIAEMIRVIQRGAHRTKEIVQALHNYSRGDDDRLVEVDLQRGIDESLDLLRHHLKNGIAVERQYGDVGRVKGHAGQLHQVFMNLLTNAAQAIGARGSGTIRIATARGDGRAVITVADDGPGIPPEVLPRIFDPFFTTKDVGEGSGLGLSIVHGIVERHGGTISVASDVGKGTTFTVSLPTN